MGKGRLVLDVWKDHEADPFFWILLEGVKDPYKTYYGREGWEVDLNKRETRAKYATDDHIVDAGARVISSIDISGPMDEIIVLIEFAGYHGCGGPASPSYLRAPKKSLTEISGHLATLPLLQELAKNDRERTIQLHTRSSPLERETRYDKGAYKGRWRVVTGRHRVIDINIPIAALPDRFGDDVQSSPLRDDFRPTYILDDL